MSDRRLFAWITLLSVASVGLVMGNGPLWGQEAPSDTLKSAKERLSDKASDEQRVNNCHVPVEKRGTKPRPDCPEPTAAARSNSGQAERKQEQ